MRYDNLIICIDIFPRRGSLDSASKKHTTQKNSPSTSNNSALLNDIKSVIVEARAHVRQAVNNTMVHAYWQIGRLIVEDEQLGNTRAQYGKNVLKSLSTRLSADLGKGFDVTNLRNMRRFYLAFEK